jgi:hypothetical protein
VPVLAHRLEQCGPRGERPHSRRPGGSGGPVRSGPHGSRDCVWRPAIGGPPIGQPGAIAGARWDRLPPTVWFSLPGWWSGHADGVDACRHQERHPLVFSCAQPPSTGPPRLAVAGPSCTQRAIYIGDLEGLGNRIFQRNSLPKVFIESLSHLAGIAWRLLLPLRQTVLH